MFFLNAFKASWFFFSWSGCLFWWGHSVVPWGQQSLLKIYLNTLSCQALSLIGVFKFLIASKFIVASSSSLLVIMQSKNLTKEALNWRFSDFNTTLFLWFFSTIATRALSYFLVALSETIILSAILVLFRMPSDARSRFFWKTFGTRGPQIVNG